MAISSPKFHCLALAIVMISGLKLISSNQEVFAQSCHTDVLGVITQCGKYVAKSGPDVYPSPECCSLVQSLDIPCVCKLLTNQIQDLISMEKVVYVARSCGKAVSPGTKCGSYTVPSA
ncbi:LTP_2 domain-containing protein [Cephalotus follicularis]|uniref:LTP_2 domain-containing protein n=1 Tax=Cephalotus follicularis TaxID=3775 RepID=A0A1Q3D743_CEPFO|nr:LTP_2 domain-containing protein [Cephalotus follicularis]